MEHVSRMVRSFSHCMPATLRLLLLATLCLWVGVGTAFAEIPPGAEGFKAEVKPFFETYCIECHGPEKSKGKITLHTLDGDLAAGADGELERWERILEVLESGEMPPEDEPQPSEAERAGREAVDRSGHARLCGKGQRREARPRWPGG